MKNKDIKVKQTGELNTFEIKITGKSAAKNPHGMQENFEHLKAALEPNAKSLEDLLEEWSVMPPGVWENDLSNSHLLKDWYAVCNNDGIVAYFGNEKDALSFRLNMINQKLNG